MEQDGRMKKKILIGVSVLAAAAFVALALRPSPVPVSVAEAREGYFAEFVEDEGFTRLRFTRIVTAPIGGYLHRVHLEPGDPVAAGEVLFRVAPFPAPALDARSMEQARENLEAARARVAAARADHDSRKHDADFARREQQRHALLLAQEVISQAAYDRVQNALDRSLAAEEAARAAVAAAVYEMENARAVLDIAGGAHPGEEQVLAVRSPENGLVLRRERFHEGVVQAGEVILEMGRLDDLEVQVDLLSSEAVRVRSGMRVALTQWGGPQALDGRVRRVEPAGFKRVSALGVDEQRVPVYVEITSPWEARKHLGEGYRVEARFILWEDDPVLHVPYSALFRDQEQWHLFVVDGGRAVQRQVDTGRRSGLLTQITSGLQAGEIVITHPGDRIQQGTRVQAPGAPP
jgi:HlyD family secretion protein